MTDRDVQTIYVHDKYEMKDDGEIVYVPSLNTYGEISNREALAEAVSNHVKLDDLSNEVDQDIGEVVLVDGEVEEVNLYDWILRDYGHDDS